MSQDRRHDDENSAEFKPTAPSAPGKSTATARLSPRPLIFRVESAEAARELGAAFGPRNANGVAAGADSYVQRAASSTGSALPDPVRSQFESSLGADLSSVRVHTGSESAEAASAVGAKAYTTGNDIHFGAGQYAPSDPFGLHLLAHEVAHTVQQSGSAPTTQYKLEVSTPGDHAEVEADRAADAMVAGRATTVTGASTLSRVIAREKAADGLLPAGADTSHSFKIADVTLGKAKAGPIDFEFKANMGASYSTETPEAKPAAGEKGEKSEGAKPVTATVGTSSDKSGASFELELKKELSEGWGFKPEIKTGVKFNDKKVELGVGFSASHKLTEKMDLDVKALEFSIVKWEVGKAPELAVLSTGLSLKAKVFQFPYGGKDHKVGLSGGFEVEAKPDLLEIGKYLSEQLGVTITTEAALMAGIIGAGLFTVVYGFIDAFTTSDVELVPEKYAGACLQYARAFQSGARGEPAPEGGVASIGGYVLKTNARKGWEAGKDELDKRIAKLGAPREAIIDEMKKHNIASDAWSKNWPTLKQKAIDAYKEKHYIEMKLSGGEGWGSGGLVTLKRVLDAYDTGPYSNG